jgi:RNA polymerase sigma factor (sigma-70 family)
MNKRNQSEPQGEGFFTASNGTPEPHLNDMIQQLLGHESAFRVFLRRRVGDETLAEDLLQQSIVRAVQSHHSVRNDDSVVAWFYTIIRHTLIDYYRSKGADARRNEAFLQELTLSGDDKEPPLDEVKATVCTCLHRLLPMLRSNYSELIRRIDLEDDQVRAGRHRSLNLPFQKRLEHRLDDAVNLDEMRLGLPKLHLRITQSAGTVPKDESSPHTHASPIVSIGTVIIRTLFRLKE